MEALPLFLKRLKRRFRVRLFVFCCLVVVSPFTSTTPVHTVQTHARSVNTKIVVFLSLASTISFTVIQCKVWARPFQVDPDVETLEYDLWCFAWCDQMFPADSLWTCPSSKTNLWPWRRNANRMCVSFLAGALSNSGAGLSK